MEVFTKAVLVEGKEIKYTHISQGSDRICFMFSGNGYTYDKPLLYYSTMLMLQNGIDVVHTHYQYQADFLSLPFATVSETIVRDVHAVMKTVLEKHYFFETIFIGKSLGTIPIVESLLHYQNAKKILLTPLLGREEIYHTLLNSIEETLIVIGESDHHFDSNQVLKLKEKHVIHTIPCADHSIDIIGFDTQKSITAISETMNAISVFLKTGEK